MKTRNISDFLVWVYFGLVRLASSFIEIELYFYEQFTFIPNLAGRREGVNGDGTNNRYKPSICKKRHLARRVENNNKAGLARQGGITNNLISLF